MNKVFNEVTKKWEVQFPATLLSISDSPLTNQNGKNYLVGTVRYKNVKGESKTASAVIYEGNYSKGMEVGETYLCTANQDDKGNTYLRLSHLMQTERASADDFDFSAEAVETPAKVSTLEQQD